MRADTLRMWCTLIKAVFTALHISTPLMNRVLLQCGYCIVMLTYRYIYSGGSRGGHRGHVPPPFGQPIGAWPRFSVVSYVRVRVGRRELSPAYANLYAYACITVNL